MGGGGGGSGPTLQQQQLQTEQALENANLNLEENSQRKSILNAMQGTRVFRESALSRAVAGNAPGAGDESPAPPASKAQNSNGLIDVAAGSLLDTAREDNASGSGSTPAGGTGASGGGGRAAGGGAGGGARAGAGQK